MSNDQSDRELQRRLEKLEIELNTPPSSAQPVTPGNQKPSATVSSNLNKFISLFKALPNAGKIIVAGVGIVVGFAILRTLLSLVASLFSLAFLGLLVYGMYQFLLNRNRAA
ncbi:hypothetical protein [Aliterella atlantica]|uniref:Uncharacterized protein n=1 Tax=Aliterella atlantica CENA595 TaxID=1618023 RepID=A0A0D8ZPW3_9CYAN|nr:hypothetical protein [Aliterella atlantica]KJH70848.1 hypothetical protein UH38_15750 [Aliterella atlantica CENA595]